MLNGLHQLHVFVCRKWIKRNNIEQYRQCTYNCEARSCSHCNSEKTINITYSEYVFVVLGSLLAMRMWNIVICGLPGTNIFFPHWFIKSTVFEKKKLYCVFICSANLSEQFLILRIIEWDVIKMYISFHLQWPLFLPDCNEPWNFRQFSKNPQISNFLKTPLMGADLLYADRRD
jgi:hypothetical protein